jgi:hypothetical protein
MKQPSQHYNMQHPAVGAVACPVCAVPRGVPCVTTPRALLDGQRTETHVGRVKAFIQQRAREESALRSFARQSGVE